MNFTRTTPASGNWYLSSRLFAFLRVLRTFRFEKVNDRLVLSCVRVVRRELRMEDRFLVNVAEGRSGIFVKWNRSKAYRGGLLMINGFSRYNDRHRRDLTNSHLANRNGRLSIQIIRRLGDGTLLNVAQFGTVVPYLISPAGQVNGKVVAYGRATTIALRRGTFIKTGSILGVRLISIRSFFKEVGTICRREIGALRRFVQLFRCVRVSCLVVSVIFTRRASKAHLRTRVRIFHSGSNFRFELFNKGPIRCQRGLVIKSTFKGKVACSKEIRRTYRRGRATRTLSR